MTAQPLTANPEAERAFLACLMRSEDGATIILSNRIGADHFAMPVNREAFCAISELLTNGTQPDAATLRSALSDATRIELETSLSENASAANASVYARLLKDAKRLRAEQAAIQQIQKSISDGCGLDELRDLIAKQAERLPPKGETKALQTSFSAAELLMMEFPDPAWLLPDVLPETGCYLLCGKPKSGKSWFALTMAMAIAQGGVFLNRDAPRRKVRYLALEDTPRRLHNRLTKLHQGGFPDELSDLQIDTAAPKLGKGLEEQIRRAAADGSQVVILDTLQKIRPPASKHGTQYGDDYAVLSTVKDIADDCGICILVVHHVRKAESLDDPHDDISGTNGIAGAADGSLILRRVHGKPEAVLHVTGRDLPDNELGLRFEDGLWAFAGTAAEVRTTAEQAEILDALKTYGSDGATVKTICEDTGKQRRNVAKLLGKLVDAKRVRVRRAKPADFFAVCDGPMSGNTTGSYSHSHRECVERGGGDNEKYKLSSTGSTGSIGTNSSTGTIPKAGGGTGGTAGTLVEREPNPPETRLNTGLVGNGRTAGTGGTRNSEVVEPDGAIAAQLRNSDEQANRTKPDNGGGDSSDTLAGELARIAALDIAKLLAGDFGDSDWTRIATAQAQLSERHPDAKSDISVLLAKVDAAYSARATP